MEKIIKVCTSILIGLLCLVSAHHLQASTDTEFDLFKEDKTSIGKGDFVAGAVFLTLDLNRLKKIRAAALENLTLTLPFEQGQEITLHLEKTSYLADDFKVGVQKNNTYSTLFYSPSLFYKGHIKGEKDALVALNFFNDKVTGVLSLRGQNYNIGQYGKGGKDAFVLYRESNLDIPNPFECSTEDPKFIRVERNTASSRSNNNKKVRVYIECDNHLYKNMGSSAQRVTDFTQGLMNVVATLYQDEDVELEISEIKIWSTADPYPTSSAKNARNDFASRLNGNFNGDIAHLLSNYKVNGTPPNGGSANIDVLCDKAKAVSYTNITTSYLDYPTFSWTAYAVTHEIGHNLGSPHTHSCLWPTGPIDNCWCPEGGCSMGPEPAGSGTMMSYCHLDPNWTNACSLSSTNPGINFAAGFGRQPGDLIRLRIANATCLSEAAPPVVVAPFSVTSQVQDETCEGYRNGSISLIMQNGQTPYSYRWNTGATSDRLQNISAGTYAVTVTDRNGKKATVNAVVQGSVLPTVNAGTDKILTCAINEVILDARNSSSGQIYSGRWSKVNGQIGGNIFESTLLVNTPGTYVYTLTNNNTGCSTSDEVEVREEAINPVLQITGERITCNKTYAQLIANTNLSNAIFAWTGPNGYRSTEQNPQVYEAGLYQLLLSDSNGCSSTGQINIQSSVYQPQVSALGGVIDCQNSSIQLNANSNELVSYNWSGPGGFLSQEQSPTTNVAGIYTVIVTTADGCKNTTTAQVGQSLGQPTLTAQGGTLTCQQNSIALQVSSTDNTLTYTWTGPNGFSSSVPTPRVQIPGVYTVTGSTQNGCSATQTVTVQTATTAPRIQIEGVTINCTNSNATLKARSADPINFYQWEGPNGFSSTQADINVNLAGTYHVTATNANGCSARTSYTVTTDINAPNFEITGGILSCTASAISLGLSNYSGITSYNWVGPDNFQSSATNPVVDREGTYVLTATSANGCSTTKSYTVLSNNTAPSFQIVSGKIDCATPTTHLEVVTNSAITSYQWTGPNGFLSYEARPIVSLAGTYNVSLNAANGCTAIQSYTLSNDTARPTIAITAAHLSCSRPSVPLVLQTTDAISTFTWTGPNGFLSYEATPTVNLVGTYTLNATGINGCSSIQTVEVIGDLSVPDLAVTASSLGCNSEFAQLTSSTTSSNVQYLWTGPNNFRSSEQNPQVQVAGIYQVGVYQANGCYTTKSVEVKGTGLEIANVIVQDDYCGSNEGSIKIEMANVSDTYFVSWNTGHRGLDLPYLPAGTYTATIKTVSGCSTTVTRTINRGVPISLLQLNASEITCNNAADGRLEVGVTGGQAPYELLWSNGVEGNINGNLEAGMHSLEVTDASNCVKTFYFDMKNPEPLEVVTEIGEGEAEFFVSGGVPNYTYNWSNGMASDAAYDLENGDYQVTISDANGCQVLEQFTLKSFDIIENSMGQLVEVDNNQPTTAPTDMISPNPADTYFNLYYELEKEELVFISVFNAQGFYLFRKTLTTQTISETIETSSWKNGSYYVQILTKDGFVTEELKVIHN